MVPAGSILEACATMIVGILFIATLAEAMQLKLARSMLLFCITGVIPFSITAILVLLEFYQLAKWMGIISFVLFSFIFTFILWAITVAEERKQRND